MLIMVNVIFYSWLLFVGYTIFTFIYNLDIMSLFLCYLDINEPIYYVLVFPTNEK